MKFLELIEAIPDPRIEGKVRHSFSTILFTALCGVLSGCESWTEIHHYCESKLDWLSKYVDFDEGVPSKWTFRRVFTTLSPDLLEELLLSHANQIVNQGTQTKQISIDGKALCGSGRIDVKCLQSVSAWCNENNLVLGEKQTDAKSNEITAIPQLLRCLALNKSTVTIDAAGCQKSIAALITSKKGNYVFGLKRNQKSLYNAVQDHINIIGVENQERLHDSFDDSHGRLVRRRYFGIDVSSLPQIEQWQGAKTVIATETISSKDNDPKRKVTATWRYYLSSHKSNNKELPDYIRNHWAIENKLHWVLDVHMKEDDDKKAERKSARSFALLRRIALNIVRSKDKTPKKSLKVKLKNAAWDNNYLLKLLS